MINQYSPTMNLLINLMINQYSSTISLALDTPMSVCSYLSLRIEAINQLVIFNWSHKHFFNHFYSKHDNNITRMRGLQEVK